MHIALRYKLRKCNYMQSPRTLTSDMIHEEVPTRTGIWLLN